jgi:manganese transport protein
MAFLLQALAARLGIASGRDLAQACRDSYSRGTTIVLWILCEIAIAACDLAEVIGSAIALNLLFGLPMTWGVCLTSADVLLVLWLQQHQFRYVEALVVLLILGIAGSLRWSLVPSARIWSADEGLRRARRSSAIPTCSDRGRHPGATVMPRNLYLHSSIVQTRK